MCHAAGATKDFLALVVEKCGAVPTIWVKGAITTMKNTNEITRRQFVTSAASAGAVAALPAAAIAESTTQDAAAGAKPSLTPYLLFNGNCGQAMEFYKSCLGGELALTKVKDSAAKDHMQAFQQEKVLNAKLSNGALEISASDWLRVDETPIRGNTVCLYLSGGTFETLSALFERLSDGAEVTDPLKNEFFGVYGALNDRFGVRWMFVSNK